jgi:molybdenum cofactor cytidylyltransferase
MVEIAAILLAAGRASRFRAAGGVEASKLVAMLADKPLVRHAALAAIGSQARPVIAVTGHERAAVEAALDGLEIQCVYNAAYATGLASSLKRGISCVPASAAGAIILLGDMPSVTAALIDRLVAAYRERPGVLAIAPHHQGGRGNPVLLSRALFSAIERLDGDEGARKILAGAPLGQIIEIEVPGEDAALDVDTPQALAKARPAFER